MSTAICHTRQELLRQQEAVFNSIPGLNALRHSARIYSFLLCKAEKARSFPRNR